MPRPSTKFPQGNVPNIMPRLPKSVGTKFITLDAVPTLSFASCNKISIANGRATAPITVNGKKLSRKISAPVCPTNKTKSPLVIAAKKVIRNIPTFVSESFSLRYKIGPAIDAAEFTAKK